MANDGLGAIGAQASTLAKSDELAQARRAGALARSGDAEEAAQRFEELLATMLVREMRRGVEDGFFGGGPGADVFEGWLDDHLGKSLARDGVFDLAQAVRISLGLESGKAQNGAAEAASQDEGAR